MNFRDELNKIYKCVLTHQYYEYNQYRIQPTELLFNDDDVEIFNKIVNLIHLFNFNTIIRTKSGGISNNNQDIINNSFAYDIRVSTSKISLTIIDNKETYNIVVGKSKKEKVIEPIKAWNKFIEICQKYNINLDDYKITTEEGKEIIKNKEIPSPYISMVNEMSETDEGLTNVHHIDIHSSYPSGLIAMYPEFEAPIKEIYELKESYKLIDEYQYNLYKAILNYTISGCTMSKYRPWNRQWTHIAKFVRKHNNDKIDELSFFLTLTGRKILGYNTDGIWYQGDIYHGYGEGTEIGQWENDHVNCIFRSRSKGAYEFIENNTYHPVVRGTIDLDKIKGREDWEWGDIYKGSIQEFDYDENTEHIVRKETIDD